MARDFGPVPTSLFECDAYLDLPNGPARLLLELYANATYYGRFPAGAGSLGRLTGRRGGALTGDLQSLVAAGFTVVAEVADLKTQRPIMVGEIAGYDEDCPSERVNKRGDGKGKVKPRFRSPILDAVNTPGRTIPESFQNGSEGVTRTVPLQVGRKEGQKGQLDAHGASGPVFETDGWQRQDNSSASPSPPDPPPAPVDPPADRPPTEREQIAEVDAMMNRSAIDGGGHQWPEPHSASHIHTFQRWIDKFDRSLRDRKRQGLVITERPELLGMGAAIARDYPESFQQACREMMARKAWGWPRGSATAELRAVAAHMASKGAA